MQLIPHELAAATNSYADAIDAVVATLSDDDYVPPCRKHHVEDCPDVDC